MSHLSRIITYPANRLGLSRVLCIAIGTSLLGACDLTTVPMPEPTTVEPAITGSGPEDTQVLGYTAKLPLTNPDAKPTGLEASAETDTILLTWTDNSEDEQGFLIQRYDSTSWIDLATVAADVTSYVDREITPGSDYCYRVLAFNSSTQSVTTDDACAHSPSTDY